MFKFSKSRKAPPVPSAKSAQRPFLGSVPAQLVTSGQADAPQQQQQEQQQPSTKAKARQKSAYQSAPPPISAGAVAVKASKPPRAIGSWFHDSDSDGSPRPILPDNEGTMNGSAMLEATAASVRYADLEPYIRAALAKGSVPINRYKLMFLGQGRAGKTATIKNILGEVFSEKLESTVGIDEFTASVSMAAKTSAGQWTENTKPDSELAFGIAATAVKQRSANKESGLPKQDSSSPSVTSAPGPSMTVDEDIVMKCVGQASVYNDVLLAIFDYGGQSVFNVIHHLFLTTNGLYIVVFNMEWMLSADDSVRAVCMQSLRFWLQSVYIHTYQETTQTTAPVILVGTRGDIVMSETEHQQISSMMDTELVQLLSLLALVRNDAGKISFFPINNRGGNKDACTIRLMNAIEAVVISSEDAHKEIPLLWLQTLDKLQAEKRPCFKYDEVCDIAENCGVYRDTVSAMLQFWRNLGMLLWIDDGGLRDVVVLDPVDYLVAPATRIICQRYPDTSDGDNLVHHSNTQAECIKKYPMDWSLLLEQGVLTDKILHILWSDCMDDKNTLLQLMKKFGLLMPVVAGPRDLPSSAHSGLYLVPALLPLSVTQSLWTPRTVESCLFLFMPKANDCLQSMQGYASTEDIQKLCFLPIGLFERVVVRVISWCQTQLGSSFCLSDLNLDRKSVVLPFGGCMFRLTFCPNVNSIRLDVEGENAFGVYERINRLIDAVLTECFKCLTFFAMRLHSVDEKGSVILHPDYSAFCQCPAEGSVLLFLKKLQSAIGSGRVYDIDYGCLTRANIAELHGSWVSMPCRTERYDVFISYRWNEWDEILSCGLYDTLSYFAVGDHSRNLHVFVDQKCLKNGSRFDEAFVKALIGSSVAVPIVSADALKRLVNLKADQVDNLLLEWVIMLVCQKSSNSEIRSIFPIMVGERVLGSSIADDITITDLFQESIFNCVSASSMIPTATLHAAKMLLRQNRFEIEDSISFEQLCIRDIVLNGILKYLGYQAWKQPAQDLYKFCAPQIVEMLHTSSIFAGSVPERDILSVYDLKSSTVPAGCLLASKNVISAWNLIKDGSVAMDGSRSDFMALLNDLGIDDGESLAYIYTREIDEFKKLVSMIKLAKRHKFFDILGISPDTYDKCDGR